jgi:hypothetical protein
MGALISKTGQFLNGIVNIPETMLRMFPDAIFWGTGFIAFITLSYSFSVFFVSLIEGIILFNLLHYGNQQFQVVNITPGKGESAKCRTGLADVSMRAVSLFYSETRQSFPSPHIYITSFIASYIMSVLVYYRDELEILSAAYGEDYQSRIYVSTISFAGLLFIAMSYRLFSECDTATNIILSLLIGLLAGGLVAIQNNSLFGKESLNMLGLPLLRKRTADGNELLVCSPNT